MCWILPGTCRKHRSAQCTPRPSNTTIHPEKLAHSSTKRLGSSLRHSFLPSIGVDAWSDSCNSRRTRSFLNLAGTECARVGMWKSPTTSTSCATACEHLRLKISKPKLNPHVRFTKTEWQRHRCGERACSWQISRPAPRSTHHVWFPGYGWVSMLLTNSRHVFDAATRPLRSGSGATRAGNCLFHVFGNAETSAAQHAAQRYARPQPTQRERQPACKHRP
jgi:hypothetical protein